jgi:hypothetical protein
MIILDNLYNAIKYTGLFKALLQRLRISFGAKELNKILLICHSFELHLFTLVSFLLVWSISTEWEKNLFENNMSTGFLICNERKKSANRNIFNLHVRLFIFEYFSNLVAKLVRLVAATAIRVC